MDGKAPLICENSLASWIRQVSLWHFVWLSILLSEVLTSGMSLFFHGRVTVDYLVTGGIVSLLVASIVIVLIRQAQAALHDSEARFRAFMDHSPAAAFMKDEAGRIVYFNKTAERVTQKSRDQWQRKAAAELFSADTARQLKEQDETVLRTDSPLEISHTISLPEAGPTEWWGFKFPFRDASGRRFVGGMVVDVTERKRAEERLALYREAVAHSNDAIAIIDLQGNYLEQNGAHRRLLGYSDEEILGRTPAIHLGEEPFAAIAGELARSGAYRGEVTSRTKDGSALVVELSAFAVRDTEGMPVCYVGIKRDITWWKKEEEAREKLVGELQEAIAKIRILEGVLSICMHCKNIRDEQNHWQPVEVYVRARSDAEFSHGICPECLKRHYSKDG